MPEIDLGRVVGPGVPAGGAADSILAKLSADDYDTGWETLSEIGQKLIAPTNPVGAVLSRVETTTVSIRAVTVTANELQTFIDSLPKLLTEILNIRVNGVTTNALRIDGFYGPGQIYINANGNWKIQDNIVRISNCSTYVSISGLNVSYTAMTADTEIIKIDSGSLVGLSSLTITGNNQYGTGVRANIGAYAYLNDCSIRNCLYAVMSSVVSIISVDSSSDAVFSGNNIGALVSRGGLIMLSGYTPETLGGASNAKNGGMIVAKNGTLL